MSCNPRLLTVSAVQNAPRCANGPSPAKYIGQNNVYYPDGCPAIMSDGRFITFYNSTNELTEAMKHANGFQSENKFRTFLQANGSALMNAERTSMESRNTCFPATACSQGWKDLWTQKGGSWAN